MEFNSLVLVTFILTLLGLAESGMHRASIKSKYGQLVTSNTLRWTAITGGDLRIPKEAVDSGTGNPDRFICRAEHHGALLVGQTTEIGSYCVVGFINRLYKKRYFEILINDDRSARLEWQPYNKYAEEPIGAVAGVDESSASIIGDNNIFIGRHFDQTSTSWLPGSIEVPRRSSGFGVMRVFNSRGQMSEESKGDILVEIEPVHYEVEIHSSASGENEPQRTKKILRSDVVLAKSSLFRFNEGRDVEARMQKVLSYDYEKSEYYGQIPGMIRALPTTIRLPNGQVQSALWGLPEKSQQHETIMVGHSLQHNKAVDVSVVGIRITQENPYRATLTSVFPDGSRRQRIIEGVVQSIYLDNIRPEYSRVYHIKESVASSSSGSGILTATGNGSSSMSKEGGRRSGGSLRYDEQFRNNEVRDSIGQKRQTNRHQQDDQFWPEKKVGGPGNGSNNKDNLDKQQQLLMASSSSARPLQYCSMFASLQIIWLVILIQKKNLLLLLF